ncbi:hypothetical protein QBC39DRAFT_378024 [Podospora conica]|nr:hypothetical protein QBC39DRAFT_378024 [Schizothecium conicum]
MAPVTAPVTFRRYRPLPPTIDRQLFSYFFGPKGPERYTFWRDDRADYQLRVFGGPGTGKTTLASLIVEDLHRAFSGATIASVFLEECSSDADTTAAVPEPPEAFIQRFRAEVRDQIRVASKINPPRDDGEHPSSNPCFLLVDDIDILWSTPETYHALEAELTKFRSAGWRVAATTRVLYPLRKQADLTWWSPLCDCPMHDGPDSLDDDIWWMCEPCLGHEKFICGRCRAQGHGCVDVREHGTKHFIQPYATYGLETLEVIICNVPKDDMTAFIARELQREHGDLQLDGSKTLSFPPLSPLGRSLLATGRARDLVAALVTRAEGNILLALLRLEYTRACSSAEEAIPATDRLPAEIVAALRAAITRVCAGSRGGLGLDAIRFVAPQPNHAMEWRTLYSELVARGWGSRLSPEEVVAASEGLLKTSQVNDRQYIRCYHLPFGLYVRDRYDERV